MDDLGPVRPVLLMLTVLGIRKGLAAWRRRRGADLVRADADRDVAWLFPPNTVSEAALWDDYWQAQVTHGVVGFTELFCDDAALVDAMRVGGLRTVLCVGNGLSHEARALAACGFAVTALDLSPWATEMAAQASPTPALRRPQLWGGGSTLGRTCGARLSDSPRC